MVRLGRSLLLALSLSLLLASAAAAAPRYAGPGGTGADPCDDPADPCSIYAAADASAPGTTIQAGDTVELAPGTYSQNAGDLGPNGYVVPPAAVGVRGEPGKAKPLIVLQINSETYGAFFVSTAVEITDLVIRNQAANGSAITIVGGTMNRVVARNTVSPFFTCAISEGEIGSSACLNEAGGVAMGVSTQTFTGVHASNIRNSTAIAIGSGSVGMDFAYFATENNTIGAVNALGVIAKGEAKDVIARGKEGSSSGKGATTLIELQASDYATISTETSGPGTAIVAAP